MKKLRTPSKQDKKLLLAIIAAAAVMLIVVAVIISSALGGKNDTPSADDSGDINTDTSDNTPPPADGNGEYGEGEIDPENAEKEEDGTDVNADELESESGRSNGIDVSKWQGYIDWNAVKESGIEFAFIRIGYRGENGNIYKDDNADYNIQQAQKAGVSVGVYFFSTAISPEEAKEEAEWTLDAIKGYSISYPVVYDCEGFKSSESRMHALTAGERTENALVFLREVRAAGYDSMIYVARNDAFLHWSMTKIPAEHKVWIAQYSDIPYPAQDKPDYPGRFDAWQYTNKGRVNGIDGNVDMVVCYFTKDISAPKDPDAAPDDVNVPLTNEEKKYTPANDIVTAKELTNLRAAATTKSDVIATLKNGETLTRTAIGSNGWSKLDYNGQTVYAITNYLTTDLDYVSVPQSDARYNIDGMYFDACYDSVTAKEVVNLRAKPTTDSEIVASLNNGEYIDRIATSDRGWSMLSYNGEKVYAVSSYLTNGSTDADGFETVDEQVTAKIETNLRTAPSTDSSEVVYTLKNGEYIRRIGKSANGWSKLEYNGQIVYALTSYLTTE